MLFLPMGPARIGKLGTLETKLNAPAIATIGKYAFDKRSSCAVTAAHGDF
jgi:hypothetical protein